MTHQDFERENAKEWDISTNITETPRLEELPDEAPGAPFQQVLPRFQARGRGGFPARARGGPSTVPSLRSTPPIITNLRGKPPSPSKRYASTSSARSHAQPQRTTTSWAKGPGLKTERAAERERSLAAENARGKQFLGNPSASHLVFGAIGYFLWPYPFDDGSGPSNILGQGLSSLHDIRKRYETFIDWDESLHCIRLRSYDEQNTENALALVAVAARHANASLGVENRDIKHYIVKELSHAGWRSRVKPQLPPQSETVPGMSTISNIALLGDTLTDLEIESSVDRIAQTTKKQQTQLEDALTDILYRMQPLRCGMKLRVNFGHTRLSRYKKDFLIDDYSFDAFCNMMANSSRIVTTFEKNLGGTQDAATMINHIVTNGTTIFEPATWQQETLGDVIEQYRLILFIRVLESEKKNELIRVESIIDSPEHGCFQAGTTNYFLHDKQVARMGFHSIDLESRLDWCLQLTTTDEIAAPSKFVSEFVNGSISSIRRFRADEQGQEYPAIAFKPNALINIEGVLLRGVRSYAIKDTPYILELAIYRRWLTSDTKGPPQTSLGLSISNREWDDDLRALDDDRPRTWHSCLRGLVNEEEKEDSQITQLAEHIERVRTFLAAAQK